MLNEWTRERAIPPSRGVAIPPTEREAKSLTSLHELLSSLSMGKSLFLPPWKNECLTARRSCSLPLSSSKERVHEVINSVPDVAFILEHPMELLACSLPLEIPCLCRIRRSRTYEGKSLRPIVSDVQQLLMSYHNWSSPPPDILAILNLFFGPPPTSYRTPLAPLALIRRTVLESEIKGIANRMKTKALFDGKFPLLHFLLSKAPTLDSMESLVCGFFDISANMLTEPVALWSKSVNNQDVRLTDRLPRLLLPLLFSENAWMSTSEKVPGLVTKPCQPSLAETRSKEAGKRRGPVKPTVTERNSSRSYLRNSSDQAEALKQRKELRHARE
ncbi:hypothetical protein SASPL_155489 (mitochondrion) [Salvia splendens]|uniref:Uncharacterized protein n=1 Tax=Salvia splendens TaxID=180675 RepID=A0A8X8VWV1_SALSN|nr:hypothetical protein SASPL_156296 [Salvia splendens]KAG6384646.1 hypothetical protein SASPL_155489 [Salvia splendens]